MASVVIQGDTSGSVTLQAPAVAGSTTVNLPSTIGNAGTSAVVTTDASGNAGIGVTPSAWVSSAKGIQFGPAGSLVSSTTANALMTSNAYYDGTNWRYINTNTSTYYSQNDGVGRHAWFNAPSGTAGNAITFTQAMTLDASGNFYVGTTSQVGGSNITFYQPNNADLKIAGAVSTATRAVYQVFVNTAVTTVGTENSTGGSLASGTAAYATVLANNGAYPICFATNNAERGRFTSAGYFKASSDGTYYGATAQYHELKQTNAGDAAVVVNANNASYTGPGALFVDVTRNTTNNTYYAISYYNNTAAAYRFRVADSGNCTNTNGSYGTISDAKMKTDIVDAGSQWDDIKAVRFRKFKMKDDPDQIVQLGVVAQELEQTSPGLVEEHKDTDKDGNDLGTTTKSVKTSVLLMKAAVALQEAMLRIENLETEIAALKAAGSN